MKKSLKGSIELEQKLKSSRISNPLLVIVGPTASGKSDLAVELAKRYNGEIISADSRQVYRGLNIGSGKISKREMQGIPHYLLDVASPKRTFTVDQFKKLATKVISAVQNKGKLPILVGGTGFYIQAVVDNIDLPKVKPDRALRKKLDKLSSPTLYAMLLKLDPQRGNEIDRYNKVRLIRAIEIALAIGKVPRLVKKPSPYNTCIIGIEPQGLEAKIDSRLTKRLRQGLIAEVKQLHHTGLTWKRLESFGLEYRYVAQYLQGKTDRKTMASDLLTAIRQYAKRQMTWFKRDPRIHWLKNPQEAEAIVARWLK